MSIRTKIILVFLLSSIVPFVVVGSLVYLDVGRLIGGGRAINFGYQLVFFAALLTLFVSLIGSLMSRVIVEPIQKLSKKTALIREGDFATRIEIGSKDEIGRLMEDFNAMAAGLGAIDRAKTELGTLISHQLRTPATAVQGYLSMLLDGYAGKLTAEQRKLLQSAFEEGEKELALISSVLKVSAVDATHLNLKKQPVDLTKLINGAIKGERDAIKQHKHEVKADLKVPAVLVSGDEEYLQLLVENLLSNAIKYSPDKSKIEVSAYRSGDSGVLQVADTGFGIAPKDQMKLFEVFSRIDTPKTSHISGSGLGLYMVKKIVDAHQGKIHVSSSVDHGSTFTVRLPLASPQKT